MLHASLSIDLPSELPRPPAAVEKLLNWLKGKRVFAEPDPELEKLLIDNFTAFEGLLGAFGDAGFDDVIAVMVDGKPAYLDREERLGDLSEAMEKTVQSGAVTRGYQVMRTTFCCVVDDLRVLGELRCYARVPESHPEGKVRLSARPMSFDPGPNEGPREYAKRIREYVRDPSQIERQRKLLEEISLRLQTAIPKRIPKTDVRRVAAPRVVVIAPGPRQVGRMRHLGFRDRRRRTLYSPLPSYERIGPYDDPLVHHYYSPYQDLFNWIVLGEILAGHWALPYVDVLHPAGQTVMRGEQGASFDPAHLKVARNAVRVSPEGQLVIDTGIPNVSSLDPAEAGNPHGPGWAGEQWTNDIDDDG